MPFDSHKDGDSIARQSTTHFIAKDDSLASLLLNHGIKIRDCILLSFLSDQGPMTVLRLSRIVGLEPRVTLHSLQRLSSANLVLRDPAKVGGNYDSIVRLTTRGEDIAGRVFAEV